MFPEGVCGIIEDPSTIYVGGTPILRIRQLGGGEEDRKQMTREATCPVGRRVEDAELVSPRELVANSMQPWLAQQDTQTRWRLLHQRRACPR